MASISKKNKKQIQLPAGLAQLVEQLICNQWVGGSNPSSGTNIIVILT